MQTEMIADTPAEVLAATARLGGCEVDDVEAMAVPYAFGSPATAGLWRVSVGGSAWFVKRIQHPASWPGITFLPPAARDQFLREFPWRFELDMARSGIEGVMPPGLRTARLDHVEEPDDAGATLWWEWIDDVGTPWTIDDYVTAARGLGRLAARRREGAEANGSLPPVCLDSPRGYALRMYAEKRTMEESLPRLRAEGARENPAVASALADVGPQVWDRMLALGDRIPAILYELDALPQTFAHGDASPQNLLRPREEPGTVVAIDWGFGTLLAVGFDLGQLVVGLVHAGLAPAAEVPALVAHVLPAYVSGLADEGWEPGEDVVRRGFVLSVQCRSVIDSFPFDLVDDPGAGEVLRERLRLAQVLLDLGA